MIAAALGLSIAALPAAGHGAPARARSVLTTTASGPVTRRGQISDTAVLSATVRPTGTITFKVFGPTDPTCAGRPAATSTRLVGPGGRYVSDAYAAPAAGVYRFVAVYSGDGGNAGAATTCGDPGESVAVSDPPPPVLGKSFQVGPISGRIYVEVPAAAPGARGSRAATATNRAPLVESRNLPFGSVVYANAGVARVTSAANAQGGIQAGDFASGQFIVLQTPSARGLTELDLSTAAAAERSCSTTTPGRARPAARRRLSRRVLAQLHSSVAGAFRTRGRFSAATVRGPSWDTVERCDGTLTRVHRGVVVVTDFRRGRSIVVRAGGSYLAQAP